MVFGAAIQFENQILIYQTRLMEFIDVLTHYIPSQEEFSANSTLRGIASTMSSLISNIIQRLLNAGTTAGIIILTTAFLLIDAANTPEKINSELEQQSKLQMRMSKFDKNLVRVFDHKNRNKSYHSHRNCHLFPSRRDRLCDSLGRSYIPT